MSLHIVPQTSKRRNSPHELILTPRRTIIDAHAARRLLAGTARLLQYASASLDDREVAAGLELIRKVTGMLPSLEVG
jgi:hypothetical protein